jgi:hypothetical protein
MFPPEYPTLMSKREPILLEDLVDELWNDKQHRRKIRVSRQMAVTMHADSYGVVT